MGIQTPMAQGRSTKIISMIKWIRISMLSMMKSLSSTDYTLLSGHLRETHLQRKTQTALAWSVTGNESESECLARNAPSTEIVNGMSAICNGKRMSVKLLGKKAGVRAEGRRRSASEPPWRQPRGKSQVNLSQTLLPGGSISMGVDLRKHLFAPGLSPGWVPACDGSHARQNRRMPRRLSTLNRNAGCELSTSLPLGRTSAAMCLHSS